MNEIYRHIKKSTKKSLIDKISKRLLELEFKSNHSIITKTSKRVVKKKIAIVIKHGSKRKKSKTYCFSCKNFTYNTQKDKEIMRNKAIRKKSSCFNCNRKKSTLLKQRRKVNIEPPRIFH